MKKFSVSLAILALALVVVATALAFVGCKNEADDSPLNGRWLDAYGTEFTFSGSNFSRKYNGVDIVKGTYKDTGSSLELTITDLYLDAESAAQAGTTAGWKTISWYAETLKQMGATDAEINQEIAPVPSPIPSLVIAIL